MGDKMKKILIIIIIAILLSILTYFITVQKKIDVIVIGDSVATGETFYGNLGISFNYYLKDYLKNYKLGNYDTNYTKNNMTIKEITLKIRDNIEINHHHIQETIKTSEYIIIALGQDELVNNSRINNLQNIKRKEFYSDYTNLLSEIRAITKKPIFIIGFFGKNIHQLNEIEKNMQIVANNNECHYINIKHLINEKSYFDSKREHLNYLGHNAIFNQIKNGFSL